MSISDYNNKSTKVFYTALKKLKKSTHLKCELFLVLYRETKKLLNQVKEDDRKAYKKNKEAVKYEYEQMKFLRGDFLSLIEIADKENREK